MIPVLSATVTLLALGLAALPGWLVVRAAFPSDRRLTALRICLVLPVGLSLNSLVHFFWLLATDGTSIPLQWIELTILWLCSVIVVRMRKTRRHCETTDTSPIESCPAREDVWPSRIAAAAAFICLVLATHAVSSQLLAVPFGHWDAWAFWNPKAAFLFDATSWKWIFSPQNDNLITHPDYPLLHPLCLARLWTYVGFADPASSQMLSLVTFLCTWLMLISIVGTMRGCWLGCVAGLFALSFTSLPFWAGSQFVDMTLAMYMLGALGLLWLDFERSDSDPRLLALAGFLAGAAAWSKNEGIPLVAFIMVVTAAVSLTQGRLAAAGKRAAAMAAGLTPFLVCLAILKFGLRGDSYLFEPHDWWAALTDGDRHRMILHCAWTNWRLKTDTTLILLSLALLVAHGISARHSLHALVAVASILLWQAATYYVVYLITPQDLEWHLNTSLDRLMLQLWPSAVMVIFMLAKPHAAATFRNQP